MTENIPSSTRFGGRPRISTTRSYSASDSPCSATTCGVISVIAGSAERLDQGAQQGSAVGAAGARIGGALGMGHDAQHVASGAQKSRNVGGRAVRVVEIAKDDPVLVLQALQLVRRAHVATVVVSHRQLDGLARPVPRGED